MKEKKAAVNLDKEFTKEQLLASQTYRADRDLVAALLVDGASYTLEQVETMLNNYKKGKVK